MSVQFLSSRAVCRQSAAATLAFAAMFLASIACVADEAATVDEKMSDTWSRTVQVADPPDAKFGVWHFWVQEGWLMAERCSGDGDIEWKIVLAKVVGDELPEIVVNRLSAGVRAVRRDVKEQTPAAGPPEKIPGALPAGSSRRPLNSAVPGPTGPMPGSLRVSYGGGRYFIRDGFSYLRCMRQPKSGDDRWPKLEVPPRDAQGFGSGMAGSRTAVLAFQVSHSWITVAASPQGAMRAGNQGIERTTTADCLIRMAHIDLREPADPLKGSGGEMASVTLGDWFVLDDGDLLVAKKLDAWYLPNALMARAQRDPALATRLAMEKLAGSPAPELSGEWLNAEKPPTWESLRGKPVLLVLLNFKQPSFLPLVPPLLGFQEMYGKQGLVVIGVHANHVRDEVEKRLAEEHITFPVVIDDGKTAERYGIGFSACLLIDREGKVVSVYKDSLAPPAEIEKLLKRKEE